MRRLWGAFAALLAVGVAGVAACAENEVPYTIASTRWPAGLGNHRARIRVDPKADAVVVRLPWRRRDLAPEKKNVVITTAAGQEVKNRVAVTVTRECGELVFQAEQAGEYFVYYLPFTENKVSWQYATQYASPQTTAEAAWLQRNKLAGDGLGAGRWRSLPPATVVEFQTWHAFHRVDPMEVIATAAETRDLVARNPGRPYLVFPEDRTRPIRMTDDLPQCWIGRGPRGEFRGEALRGEFYAFQLGVYAATRPVEDLVAEVGELRSSQGHILPAACVHGFNFGGTDWLGRPFHKTVSICRGKVAALWFGVQIPKQTVPGHYAGAITLQAKGSEPATVQLSLDVSPQVLEDGGVGDLWRQSRLQWLDSSVGLDDEIVAPYTPLVVDGRTVRCLGRSVLFGASGLPEQIRSGTREVLSRPVTMTVETAAGEIRWTETPRLAQTAPGAVVCQAASSGGPLRLTTWAKMEADGYVNYRIKIGAVQPVDVRDIRLEVPYRRDVAKYMMGLERKGGYRPAQWKWAWDVRRATNMAWLGDVDAGLHVKLKGPQDTWDIADLRAGGIPDSWGNGGQGGCTLSEEGDSVVLRATSGARRLKAGEELEYRFALLITPVKPLDPDHFRQRYYHYGTSVVAVDTIAATGANVINCHQGNALNPYINYPFLTTQAFAAYVAQAHAKGMKVKTYYTVRELSNYVGELWALRSLGHEIFLDGAGGGHSWLQEHLVSHYGSAWHQPYANGEVDAAIATTGLSRWHNYYLEGLGWLVKNVGLDGLYLDGIGYDREIMKRVRKVMDRARPGCLIDFHSGNEFPYEGLRISPACKYLEHFPYLNSLWFGEGYDYNETPDYWLVEVSGIPFGLYGEMLEGGGNPWRGMLYGMTGRLGWGGDPRPMWKVWDQFGIDQATMMGYWSGDCPVRTDRSDVLATAFVRRGKTLVAVASWAAEPVDCRLEIDWRALGLDPKRAGLFAPAIESVQPAAVFRVEERIPVYPGRGWLLVIDEEKHEVPQAVSADVYKDRAVLWEERFDQPPMGRSWKTSLSSQPGTTLNAEGGKLTIQAAANCCAIAEHPLPAGTALVQCLIDSGTDKGASWGPGLALVWPNQKPLRINLRAEGRYGVDDGTGQWFGGFVWPRSWHHLRIRLEAKTVYCEGSADGKFWQVIHSLPHDAFPGEPIAVRIGKMSPGAKLQDFSILGPPGACKIKDLRVYGRAGVR